MLKLPKIAWPSPFKLESQNVKLVKYKAGLVFWNLSRGVSQAMQNFSMNKKEQRNNTAQPSNRRYV